MDGKYIIILLFIFLVFLMGSINSTVTNNFYNNTTRSQDHAVLSNLSYADSNHTGFQSSDTLDDDVSALGYVTDAYHDDEKVNKTNEYVISNLSYMNWTAKTPETYIFNGNNPWRKVFVERTGGLIQEAVYGYVGNLDRAVYFGMYRSQGNKSNPTPTLANQFITRIFSSTMTNTSTWTGTMTAIDTYSAENVTSSAWGSNLLMQTTLLGTNTAVTMINMSASNETIIERGSLKINGLAGSGNAYDCLNSAGTHYRGSPTC